MAMTAEQLRQPLLFVIDVKKGLIQKPIGTQLMKGDRRANTVIVRVIDGGSPVDLSGATATGSFIAPPEGAEIPLTGTVSGNEARVTLADECYAVSGCFEMSVKLAVGDTARTMLSITGDVLRKGSGAVINVGGVIPSVEDIIAQYQKMLEVTERTQAAADRVEQMQIDASGLAGDANKLGGKVPEYYLQKKNLLDNSDFLVAQAGYNALHDDHFYCADRWRASLGGGVVTITKNNDYIKLTTTGYNYIFQAVEVSSLTQDEYTFTFTRRGGLSSRMLIYGVPTQGEIVQIKSQWLAGVSDWTTDVIHLMRTEFAAYETVRFAIQNEDAGSMDYKEVAVYSGLHTADNLPHYVPRGYGAELAECRRYFRKTFEADHPAGDNGYVLVRGANGNWLTNIEFGTPMHNTPTVKVYSPLSGAEKTISDFSADEDVETSATVVMANKNGFKVYCPGALDPDNSYYFHYTASADP